MKAFLLAAGLGKRLRPITNEIPKCLVPIGGKPLMEYWLRLFEYHNVHEVLINLHYLSDNVLKFLQQFNTSINIHTFYEKKLLGSAGTLLANKNWVQNDEIFLITYGDNLTDINISNLVAFHKKHAPILTMAVFKTTRPKECGIATIDHENTIINFVEKPDYPENDWANAGIFVASPQIFDYFPTPSNGILDFGFHVLPNLIGKMKAYFMDEYILDIGNLERYNQAQVDVESLKL